MFSKLSVCIVLLLAVLGQAARGEGHRKRHVHTTSCTTITNTTTIPSRGSSTDAAAQTTSLISIGRNNTISRSVLASTTAVSSSKGSNGSANSTMTLVTSTRKSCGSKRTTMPADATISAPGSPSSTFMSNGEIFVTSTISAVTYITVMQCPPKVTECPDHQRTHTVVVTKTVPVSTTVRPITASIGPSDVPIASAISIASVTDAAAFSTGISKTNKAVQTASPANNNVQDDTTTTIVMTSFSTTVKTVYATSSPTTGTEANGLGSTKPSNSDSNPDTISDSTRSCPPQVTVTVSLPPVTVTVIRSKRPCTQTSTMLIKTSSTPRGSISNGTMAVSSGETTSIPSLPVSSKPGKLPCKVKARTLE